MPSGLAAGSTSGATSGATAVLVTISGPSGHRPSSLRPLNTVRPSAPALLAVEAKAGTPKPMTPALQPVPPREAINPPPPPQHVRAAPPLGKAGTSGIASGNPPRPQSVPPLRVLGPSSKANVSAPPHPQPAAFCAVPPSKAEAGAKSEADAKEASRKKLLNKFCPAPKTAHPVPQGHQHRPLGSSSAPPIMGGGPLQARRPMSAAGPPQVGGGRASGAATSTSAMAAAGAAAARQLLSRGGAGGGDGAAWRGKSAMEAAFGSLANAVPADDSGSRYNLWMWAELVLMPMGRLCECVRLQLNSPSLTTIFRPQ